MSANASSTPGSVTGSPAVAVQQRLSEQLQALSLVGETLTLRLLELEERLGALEAQLGALQEHGSADAGEAAIEMLTVTEDRIARLEELLGEETTLRGRPQASVHPLPQRQSSEDVSEPELELNPFPEEEEQPFMDELSA
ncbi:MAG: hypothetical protein RLZZ631_779 [Cyanobacteriota bacterium]